ncbi:DMP19 family protein [Bacillus sp. AK128]
MDKIEIWNEVFTIIPEVDFPSNNKLIDDVFIISQYYSELESGGHESLFTWFGEYIQEIGITSYINKLIRILEEVEAYDYAKIVKQYGEEMWRLYIALEEDEIEEDAFYRVIEKANGDYYALDGKLADLLESYFVKIYDELVLVIKTAPQE